MENLIIDNISLILLLPLWLFLIIMCGRFFSVYVNKIITYFLTLSSSFLGAGACTIALINIKEPVDFVYPFIKINDFIISFGLHVDKLSLVIAILLFVISFAVQLFSISYMKNEKKNYRFFALLNLFNFSMAFLLFSPNLFQLYVFWELVGIVSYLLIGFEYNNPIKSIASKRVFLINRIGDTALISGIILASFYMYRYVENTSFVTLSLEDINSISALLMAYTTDTAFCIICGLFILACIVKSAQFPFYTWLQDAMEAKLPVSALLHSATMVIAGIYLAIRLLPFFSLEPVLMNIIIVTGILTALICSILASIETNSKKVLAYSTSANLGLMFMGVGLGNVKLAIIFLIAHAFIKSMLFLLLPKENTISKINLIIFLAGGLSLSGLLFAGLSAKELLFGSILANQTLSAIFIIISFITAFYITRLTALIYNKTEIKNIISRTELTSFLILLFGNIGLYIILRDSYRIKEPFAAAIGGLALAILLNKHNALEKINNAPKLFEKLYNNFVPLIYEKITAFMRNIDEKILSNHKPLINGVKLPIKLIDWVENNIMNGAVKLVSDTSKNISKQDMILQSGNVQTYNAYAFIIITLVIASIIIGYTIILN